MGDGYVDPFMLLIVAPPSGMRGQPYMKWHTFTLLPEEHFPRILAIEVEDMCRRLHLMTPWPTPWWRVTCYDDAYYFDDPLFPDRRKYPLAQRPEIAHYVRRRLGYA